jgi:hypothetical protein
LLLALLEGSRILGLGEYDIKNANEFFEYNEFGLCFDTIITQMYENDIEIDIVFYGVICKIASEMNLPVDNYSFMNELIRSESNIPKPVREELAKIISSL